MGIRKREFLLDEIALCQSPVSVEIGVVARAVLVAGSREAKIGNSRLTHGMVAGEFRVGRGASRVKRRRGRCR